MPNVRRWRQHVRAFGWRERNGKEREKAGRRCVCVRCGRARSLRHRASFRTVGAASLDGGRKAPIMAGAIVRSVAAYTAESDTELSVGEGVLLWLLDDSDADWVEVKDTTNNATGFVPKTYITEVNALVRARETSVVRQEAPVREHVVAPV